MTREYIVIHCRQIRNVDKTDTGGADDFGMRCPNIGINVTNTHTVYIQIYNKTQFTISSNSERL
jgi:hypothetical protein